MVVDNDQNIEGKSIQNKLEKVSRDSFDFLVKKKNWIIFGIIMILLALLGQPAYEYFQIGIGTAEFNILEVKIKANELGKLEKYIADKQILLAEKKQRNYRDLFR